MSFPRYPEYKDSGVEWLGQVPKHWEVRPLKRIVAEIEAGTSVNAADYPATDGAVGVLKTSCVYSGKFDPSENKTVDAGELGRVSCPVRADTLIVSRMNTPDLVGAAGVVRTAPSGIYLPDRLWQVSFRDALPSYVHYWTLTSGYRAQVEVACTGTSSSMKSIAREQFSSFALALPLISEQQRIVEVLDDEVAKIDALVAEQHRLIELLQEKRQAVISHAVTKGLNPDAPMKDSGIEWLGQIPAHWTSTRLGRCLPEGPRNGISPDVGGIGTRASFSTAAVDGGRVRIQDHQKLIALSDEDAAPFLVRRGDILILRGSGSKERVGIAGVVDEAPPDGCVFPDILIRLRMGERWASPYAIYLLNSAPVRAQMELSAQTAAGIWKISGGSLRDLVLPVPPVPEQERMTAALDAQTAHIDELTARSAQSVELLQERRAALISAAVTGQIDVRSVAERAA